MAPSVRGPFRPGTGAIPPYLAGRDNEKRLFREFLTDLSSGHPPGTLLILHGPRGNGKTALLGWLSKAVARTAGVEALTLRPAEIPDQARLREVLAPRSWWRRLASDAALAGGSAMKPPGRPFDVRSPPNKSRPTRRRSS